MNDVCMLTAEQHAEPDEVDAELFRDRPDQRNDDERQLEEVEEERQHEDQDVDDDQEAELAAGQAVSRCSTQTWPLTP